MLASLSIEKTEIFPERKKQTAPKLQDVWFLHVLLTDFWINNCLEKNRVANFSRLKKLKTHSSAKKISKTMRLVQ